MEQYEERCKSVWCVEEAYKWLSAWNDRSEEQEEQRMMGDEAGSCSASEIMLTSLYFI